MALKFVRSRHAEGDEGTDTAREARQQKVIDAIKNKISMPGTFLNPFENAAILKVTARSFTGDIDMSAAGILARRAFDSAGSITKFLIPQGLLVNPPISKTYDGQYVFIPKAGSGNWLEIQKWASSILN